MAERKPPDNGQRRPIKVERRGRFTVVTGDPRDEALDQVESVVENYVRSETRSGSAHPQSGSSSHPQPGPICVSPRRGAAEQLPSFFTTHPDVPDLDAPTPNPSFAPPQIHSGSDSARQTSNALSPGSARPARVTSTRTRTVSHTRTASQKGTDATPSTSGRPFASLSMAFFSPQLQQSPYQQFQAQQFQLQPQPQPQQLQFPQMQTQLQVPQPQLLLYTKEKAPAGWSAKFEDLHADSQKILLQIEERLREYRDESKKLDQCVRLYDASVSNDSFEIDAARIVQEIGGTNTAIEREKTSVQELITRVKDMIRNTEFAIYSYMMLRPHFVRPATGPAQNNSIIGAASNQPANQIVPAAPTMPVFDFYSGAPKRPSAFMQHTVERLQKFLEECVRWIQEVEELVQMDANRRSTGSLEALPKVMSNVHDYFIYVASKVENLHQYMESVKAAYLTEQRRHGEDADPFLEANRRETARLEAAARRVHPTLHLPPTPNPPHQLHTPNPTPTAQQPSAQPTANRFSTPAPTPSVGGLFSTPSSSLFGASAGFTPQSTPFGSTSGSLFGSTPAPSGFGSSTPGLTSTPAAAGGSTLFSTPTFGGATASGASFGGASKSARPKSRTARR